jgi:hypothetical protein
MEEAGIQSTNLEFTNTTQSLTGCSMNRYYFAQSGVGCSKGCDRAMVGNLAEKNRRCQRSCRREDKSAWRQQRGRGKRI